MPAGKPADTPCVNLDMSTHSCTIWDTDQYPAVCAQFAAQRDVCGDSREDALKLIGDMERDTV